MWAELYAKFNCKTRENIPIFFLPFKRRIAQLPIFSDRHHEDIAAIAAVVRVTRPMVKLRFSKTQNKGQPLHVYDGLEEASLALKYRGFESALPDFSVPRIGVIEISAVEPADHLNESREIVAAFTRRQKHMNLFGKERVGIYVHIAALRSKAKKPKKRGNILLRRNQRYVFNAAKHNVMSLSCDR